MRLKEQVEKEIRAIYRAKNEAKKANDTELVNIYTGMYQALKWVLDSRNSPYYSLVVDVENVNVKPKTPFTGERATQNQNEP